MLIGLMQAAQKKVNTVIEVGIVTKDLEDRGYHEELPKVYKDRREETPTVYYVNDECPYCLAEVVWRDAIREDGVIQYSWLATSFFILDRECASKSNFRVIQKEDTKRYPKYANSGKFHSRTVHRLALEVRDVPVKGLDVDHMTLNPEIITSDTLRTCTHRENVKNTRNTCRSRINTNKSRLEIKVCDIGEAGLPKIKSLGLYPEGRGKSKIWVSNPLPENELYELAVRVSKAIDGHMGYTPFWDFGYEEGCEVFADCIMLGKISVMEMCLYNVSKVKESEGNSEVLWKYAQAMYRLYGDRVFDKPKCAF